MVMNANIPLPLCAPNYLTEDSADVSFPLCDGGSQAELGRSLVGRQGHNTVPACVDKAALSACRIGKVAVAVYTSIFISLNGITIYS